MRRGLHTGGGWHMRRDHPRAALRLARPQVLARGPAVRYMDVLFMVRLGFHEP